MSRYRRSLTKGATLFFTVNTYRRKELLTLSPVRAALHEAIHYNPVKHGLVTQLAQWPYSTFHRYVNEGVYPHNWSVDPGKVIGGAGE